MRAEQDDCHSTCRDQRKSVDVYWLPLTPRPVSVLHMSRTVRDQCVCNMLCFAVYFHWQGLAMARSFGDMAAESVGVFAEPELSEIHLTPQDQFIIWASDGVWEFITSQEAVDIVNVSMADGPQSACEAVVKESTKYGPRGSASQR